MPCAEWYTSVEVHSARRVTTIIQAPESTAKKTFDFNSTVDSRHKYTIQRTAFRIFHRIFDVYIYSLPTDCHSLAG
eukprot:9468618-Pyramimonas_sp.AAC.1